MLLEKCDVSGDRSIVDAEHRARAPGHGDARSHVSYGGRWQYPVLRSEIRTPDLYLAAGHSRRGNQLVQMGRGRMRWVEQRAEQGHSLRVCLVVWLRNGFRSCLVSLRQQRFPER